MLVDVLGVVEARELLLHVVQHPRLQVHQQRTRDVLLVVGLVEEDVLAVAALDRKVLEDAVLADAVLGAQLLPELHPNLVPALTNLQRDDLARHRGEGEAGARPSRE